MAFFFTPVFIWVYFEPNLFLYVPKRSIERVVKLGYGKSSIKSPKGILYFKRIWDGGAYLGRGGYIFSLSKEDGIKSP